MCLYIILLTDVVDDGLSIPEKKVINKKYIHFCLCHYNKRIMYILYLVLFNFNSAFV